MAVSETSSFQQVANYQSIRNSALPRYIGGLFETQPQPLEAPSPSSKWDDRKLLAARVAAVAVGMVGNISFIPVIKEASNDNPALEKTLIFGSVVGFGILTSWLLLQIVNQGLQKTSAEEKVVLSNRLSNTARTNTLMAAIFLGLCSQLPPAYMAYAYNDRPDPVPIIAAMILVISNFSQPAYSSKLSIEKLLRWINNRSNSNPIQNNLETSRQILDAKLSASLEGFLTLPSDERDQLLSQIERQISAASDTTIKATQISNQILAISPNTDASYKDLATNWVKETALGIATTPFLASLLALYALGGYKAINDFSDNEGAAITVAAFVTACNAHIVFLSLHSTLKTILSEGRALASNRFSFPLAFQLSPTRAVAGYASSLFLGALCYPGAWQIAKDYFEGLGAWAPTIGVLSSVANCTLVTYALFQVTNEGVPNILARKGSPDQKNRATFANQISAISRVIDQCPNDVYANFLLALARDPSPHVINLLNESDLTVEKLETYLASLPTQAEDTPREQELLLNDSRQGYGAADPAV